MSTITKTNIVFKSQGNDNMTNVTSTFNGHEVRSKQSHEMHAIPDTAFVIILHLLLW